MPRDRYERGGSENIGKGMWTYEPFLGTTVFLDEETRISLATTGYWEFRGDKTVRGARRTADGQSMWTLATSRKCSPWART